MIQASLYQSVYIIAVTIITVMAVFEYYVDNSTNSRTRIRTVNIFAMILAVAVTFFIGYRPVSGQYFVDMASYYVQYERLLNEPFSFDWHVDNLVFDNLMTYMASEGIPTSSFFLLISSIYFILMFLACRKLFPNELLISFVVCLAAFSTFSYATNGIKAGAAASLFLVAIAYRKNILICVLFLLLSLGFHHSMELPVAAFLIVAFVKNPRVYFIIWLGALLLAIMHVTFFQEIFASLTDEQGAGYLITEEFDPYWGDVIRFRPDFVLYSSVPVIIGFFMVFRRRVQSLTYFFLLNFYLLTNSVWMLCMYAKFTNRIAYLSWFVYPVVLIYPFLEVKWSSRQSKYVPWVVFGHLAFTIFMFFIYYQN